MNEKGSMVLKGFSQICSGLMSRTESFSGESNEYEDREDKDMAIKMYNGVPDKTVRFMKQVLDDFRKNVGHLRAETGGMLASSEDEHIIDKCYFDAYSKNTNESFYYDVESMSEVFRGWKSKGYVTNGIYHSHPKGMILPSYHDISTVLLHLDFFGLEYFYFPIFQPDSKGFYTMYFYVVRRAGDCLNVNLNYVIKAVQDGYEYIPFRAWEKSYFIRQLNSYRASIDWSASAARNTAESKETKPGSPVVPKIAAMPSKARKNPEVHTERDAADVTIPEDRHIGTENNNTGQEIRTKTPTREYFRKVSSLYPSRVLEKVIVCVGTGGARSFLENCARSGFKNYVLIDADVVSPSNVATQGVFISEMGKKKVDVIRDRILDINQDANVVCVDKFLDNDMSDEEFKGYMDRFPNKKPADYLILGCTDNFEAQKRSSLLALKYGTPYLAAMMYEGGAAAEIIFVYPGVTESCPRCLLRNRFEKYENGFKNNVNSSACPIFATERMNSLKGYIALMLLMYREDPANPFSRMLDDVKDRNFVEIRLNPYLKDSKLGIELFDKVFADASKYVYFDETLWVPQHPDRPEFGSEPCRLCGGTGNLKLLRYKWGQTDTRSIRFDHMPIVKSASRMKLEHTVAGLDALSKASSSYETKA